MRQPSAQSPFASPGRYLFEGRVPSTWKGITLPSSLLRTHPPVPNPPPASDICLVQLVFAGCCQSLLGVGPSRRYLCESFPTCLDPYPGYSCGALARFFPQDFGLPRVRTGSALRFYSVQRLQVRCSITRLQSFASLQARRVARHPGRPYRNLWVSVGSLACSFPPCFQASASIRRTLDSLPDWAAVAFPSEHPTVCYLPVSRICQSSKPGN